MIKYLITITVVLYFNTTSAQKMNMQLFNDSNYCIIPFKSSQNWIFKDAKPTTLNSNEIKIIEAKLLHYIDVYNKDQLLRYQRIKRREEYHAVDKKDFLIDLNEYKTQLVPVLNTKGEKEVWVNCFCRTHDINWKKNIIQVDDGGKCYFALKINLTTKKYYEFIVNGTA